MVSGFQQSISYILWELLGTEGVKVKRASSGAAIEAYSSLLWKMILKALPSLFSHTDGRRDRGAGKRGDTS